MNSAIKLPFWHKGRLQKDDDHTAPLDYIQGAGMLNAVGAYSQLIAGRQKPGETSTVGWDNNILDKDKNSQNIYKITITEPNDRFITATVVWNRHYSSDYPFEPLPEKDANLRLELWAVDPENHNNDYMLDYSDSSTDNVEHIYTPADANYTNYEIAVSYSDIENADQMDTTQRYGLAWNIGEAQDSNNIFWYDLNADGIVNDLDITILLTNLLNSAKLPEGYFIGDINADGAIDINDMQILLKRKNLKADWYTE